MTLPSFYTKGENINILNSLEKEKRDNLLRQKNLTLDERKKRFNDLPLKDKNMCLVNIQKKMPVTPGDIDGQWYDKNGKELTLEKLKQIKLDNSKTPSLSKYYSWKSKGNAMFLREFDYKLKETDKVFSQVAEKNDLAILMKGEKILGKYSMLTFKAFRTKSKP